MVSLGFAENFRLAHAFSFKQGVSLCIFGLCDTVRNSDHKLSFFSLELQLLSSLLVGSHTPCGYVRERGTNIIMNEGQN